MTMFGGQRRGRARPPKTGKKAGKGNKKKSRATKRNRRK